MFKGDVSFEALILKREKGVVAGCAVMASARGRRWMIFITVGFGGWA